eukprot:GILJ01003587.1.p1 GENE.GILJ01003587.1~~GILJ01003587.1.p1  ORF type:complete len:101 (+),score=21.91 GILJ01003587.1:53-355(+)
MSALKRLVPLFDRILLERVQAPTKTVGGVLLPETAQTKLNQAKVVAVGPGARNRDGNIVPVSVAIGDVVLLPEYGGMNVKLGDKEYVLHRDDEIIGLLKD